jgi:hypothetical protein
VNVMLDLAANTPVAMLRAKRWLVWRSMKKPGCEKPKKIPYYTSGKERGKRIALDSEKDIAQLATFEDAQAALKKGNYSGLGFALGPDGSTHCWQGIDLDGINENGLEALAATLPGYVETSPSGKGVHAIGYGPTFKTLAPNGTGVEAYSGKRYFTFTGEYLRGDLECLADCVEQTLAPIHSPAFHRDIESQSSHESQDSQDSQELQNCRQGERGEEGKANTFSSEFPPNCHPLKKGHRNGVLFNLARHLKTEYPDSKATDHKPAVERWHQEYLPVIGTKAWAETWSDFRIAWSRVKFLEGEGPLNQAFEAIDMTKPIPKHLQQLGYDEALFKVAQLCQHLAMNSLDRETFFLGNRPLASLIGVSQPSAGNILNMLVEDGILEVVQIGKLEKGKSPAATTYRYLGIPK